MSPDDALHSPTGSRRRSRFGWWWAAPLAALSLAAGGDAWAQPGGGSHRPPIPRLGRAPRFATPPDDRDPPEQEYVPEISDHTPGWLLRSFGLGRAKNLLDQRDRVSQMRGIERLGALGTRESIAQLTQLLEAGADGNDAALVRLAAIRALAPHAAEDEARDALSAVMGGSDPGSTEVPLDSLSRQTAAMALARSGSDRAVTALAAAVIQGGEAGQSAEGALRAAVPQALAAMLGRPALEGKPKPLPKQLVALLGSLGDLRAIPVLRGQLTLKPRPVQVAAALALAHLGDGSVAPRLRSWLVRRAKGALAPTEQIAAVEGLLLLDAPGARTALGTLLRSKPTRKAALRLAQSAPGPELVTALDAMLGDSVSHREREGAVEVLSRIGTDGAATVLLRMLARPELATMAAFGLASSPSETARRGLQQALASAAPGPARRLVLRAALVRHAKLGETVEGLEAALAAARQSTDPADRWVAAQGLTWLGLVPAAELVHASDRPTAIGAATMAAAAGELGLAACAARLREISREMERAGPRAEWATGVPDAAAPLDAVACGAALLAETAPVASSVLARWAEAGGSLAPLAALALAARDPAALRARVSQLFEGTDPTIRAHVALGLGRSPQPDATSRLARSYRAETEPAVRRAIVRALSQRRDPLRQATLELAATLDPDAEARALARSAQRGLRHGTGAVVAGPEVLWLSLLGRRSGTSPTTAFRPARIERSDGIALPMVSGPDGIALVFGLPRIGRVTVHIAPASGLGDADR